VPISIEDGAEDFWSSGEASAPEAGEAGTGALPPTRLDTPSFLVHEQGDVPFDDCTIPPYVDTQVIARIQPFSGGGFEGMCYWRSKEAKWARRLPGSAIFKRERERDPDEAALSNARRAKRRVRWLCREIAADRLLTLTTREESNSPIALLARFERFVRLYRKSLGGEAFHYVAVPEPHPSNPGHWHVHVAVKGYVHVNRARAIWWAVCGGRGMGNIDVRWIRARSSGGRSEKIAHYISKYITKVFEEGLLIEGRHRYRASRVTLQERHKLVFEADLGMVGAYGEILDRLHLDVRDIRVWFFPDGSGFWFTSSGDFAASTPPF
jgi:hypothetical protein